MSSLFLTDFVDCEPGLPPGDYTLGDAMFVDLDRDGTSEAYAPADSNAAGVNWALWRWTCADDFTKLADLTVHQAAATVADWGCRESEDGSALHIVRWEASARPDEPLFDIEVTILRLVDGQMEEVDAFTQTADAPTYPLDARCAHVLEARREVASAPWP